MKKEEQKHLQNSKISARDMAEIGVMIALIEVSKFVLLGIPNVELTTFWIMLFTLYFGKKVMYVIPVFILIEGCVFGFGLWWIMYLYAWPLLVLITWLVRKRDSLLFNSIISGAFGLSFGLLCSLPYFVIGCTAGGFIAGLRSAFSWWVAGIPMDILHGVSNFVLMLVLYTPIRQIMKKCSQKG